MDTAISEVVRRLTRAEGLSGLIAVSRPMVALLELLPSIAGNDATVLVTGETGTGKELVTRAIHYLSRRANSPFVPINCGALPDSLLEAELFGHERGSFTGAESRRVGLLKEAEGGTLCLDEVDGLTLRGQVALLRVLQDKRFRAIGATREQGIDVRFIAVTNAPLTDLVQAHRFRADLYYRLCVLSIHLPPLRDRPEDVVPLAEHFLAKQPIARGSPLHLTPMAAAALRAHAWPGNVRELENILTRAAHLAHDGVIDVDALGMPRPSGREARQTDPDVGSFAESKRRAIEAFEREYLTRLLRDHHGNISRSARVAGMERRDLRKLLKKNAIDPRTFARVYFPRVGDATPSELPTDRRAS